MKKKSTLYIVSTIVVLLWGYIIYKFFNPPRAENRAISASPVFDNLSSNVVIDTFSISAEYRDPFFGKSIPKPVFKSNNNGTSTASIKTPIIVSPKVIAVNKPVVSYLGLIKNSKQNKQVALIQINGTMNNLSVGDKQDGIEVLKILKDSIEVRFQKEKYFVRK